MPVDDASPSAKEDNGDWHQDNNEDCVDAAIRIITSHPAPLVIYVFTERDGVKDRCEWDLTLSLLALHRCRVPCPLKTEMSAHAH